MKYRPLENVSCCIHELITIYNGTFIVRDVLRLCHSLEEAQLRTGNTVKALLSPPSIKGEEVEKMNF